MIDRLGAAPGCGSSAGYDPTMRSLLALQQTPPVEAPAGDATQGPSAAGDAVQAAAETTERAARTLGDRVAESAPVEAANGLISRLTEGWPDWAQALVIAVFFTVLFVAVQKIAWSVLRKVSRVTGRTAARKLVGHTGKPAGVLSCSRAARQSSDSCASDSSSWMQANHCRRDAGRSSTEPAKSCAQLGTAEKS